MQLILEFFSWSIVICFVALMLWFAWLHYRSHRNDEHKDYKSIIVSTGVLGTFTGIFMGLLGFDSNDITDSVPKLLEGLKIAFATSIVGMGLAVFLSGWEKQKGESDSDEISFALKELSKKLKSLSAIQESTKHLDTLPLMNTKLDSIDTNIKVLTADVKTALTENQKELFDFLQEKLSAIDNNLKEAVQTLAKGATEEIIKALQDVIKDFNQNLTEQFGDNFKQLNEAVLRMIEWQENYKNSIQQLEQSLQGILANTESSHQKTIDLIKQSFSEFMNANQQAINTTIENIESVVQVTNQHLKQHAETLLQTVQDANSSMKDAMQEQSELATDNNQKTKEILAALEQSLEVAKENVVQIKEVTKDYQTIATTSTDLQEIIQTNQNQIENLETHLQNLAKVGEDAGSIVTELKEFSNTVQGSLTEQSKSLSEMSNEIREQLPAAMRELEVALVKLTNKFADVYEKSLERASEANNLNNE